MDLSRASEMFSDLDTQEKLIKAVVKAETATSNVESSRISELEENSML